MKAMDKWKVFEFPDEPRISITENGVTFNRGVAQALNRPKYALILFDEENKLMAVKPCKSNEENKIDFYKSEKVLSVRLPHKMLKKYIEKLLSIDLHINAYKCCGEFKDGVVVFNLNECEKVY